MLSSGLIETSTKRHCYFDDFVICSETSTERHFYFGDFVICFDTSLSAIANLMVLLSGLRRPISAIATLVFFVIWSKTSS